MITLSTLSASEYYLASYPYQSNEPGDLCFEQGDMVLVTQNEGEWWTGYLGEQSGIFPSTYVEPVPTNSVRRSLEEAFLQYFYTILKHFASKLYQYMEDTFLFLHRMHCFIFI